MKKIVITGEKGGTGKSTLAILLIEYLNSINKKVNIIDSDTIRSTFNWLQRCQEEKRFLNELDLIKADYQIIDTAGSSGSSLPFLRDANLILVPFCPLLVDLEVIVNWFYSVNKNIQEKTVFIPNRWQNTKEQREGLNELQKVIDTEKSGKILQHLSNRPSLFGSIHNGSAKNFFYARLVPQEVKNLMTQIIEIIDLQD